MINRNYLSTFVAIVLFSWMTLDSASGQRTVSVDTIQDGGVFRVSPEGILAIGSELDPTLSLINGAVTEGISGAFFVGDGFFGTGSLEVFSGSVLSLNGANFRISRFSPGAVTVDGPGSTITDLAITSIGSTNVDGVFAVQGGGAVLGQGNINIGPFAGGSGRLLVTGTGSRLELPAGLPGSIASRVSVGQGGRGEFEILDGGYALVGQGVSVGRQDNPDFPESFGGDGTLTVAGSGSRLELINGDFRAGIPFLSVERGSAQILAGGSIEAKEVYVVSQTSDPHPAKITVDGLGSELTADGVFIGGDRFDNNRGNGSLVISNGGSVTAARLFGVQVGVSSESAGTVIVTGDGALLGGDPFDGDISTPLAIGVEGHGTVRVENGGLVDVDGLIIGEDAGSLGTLEIVGAASVVKSFGGSAIGQGGATPYGLLAGRSGNATIRVLDGARLTQGNRSAALAELADANAQITVSGIESVWEVGGRIDLGLDGRAELVLQDGGKVMVGIFGGSLNVGPLSTISGDGGRVIGAVMNRGTISPGNSPGILTIEGDLDNQGLIALEIAGPEDFDQIDISGRFIAGGIIEISLLDGYRPSGGESFPLLNYSSFVDDGASISFVGGAADLLDIEFSDDGLAVVSAIPEPSSAFLALVATLGCYRQRKR